jgi:HPt (histidine-containing phosphotransfer) domain-containing protein
MTKVMTELPGIDRIRKRFLEMLSERQTQIASHGLAAWDGKTVEEINSNLAGAQAILHQIAGSAGSLGFEELGQAARGCEMRIVDHLAGPDADLAICPVELISSLDTFVAACRKQIEAAA